MIHVLDNNLNTPKIILFVRIIENERWSNVNGDWQGDLKRDVCLNFA